MTALLALMLAANPALSADLSAQMAAHLVKLEAQVPPRIMEALRGLRSESEEEG